MSDNEQLPATEPEAMSIDEWEQADGNGDVAADDDTPTITFTPVSPICPSRACGVDLSKENHVPWCDLYDPPPDDFYADGDEDD